MIHKRLELAQAEGTGSASSGATPPVIAARAVGSEQTTTPSPRTRRTLREMRNRCPLTPWLSRRTHTRKPASKINQECEEEAVKVQSQCDISDLAVLPMNIIDEYLDDEGEAILDEEIDEILTTVLIPPAELPKAAAPTPTSPAPPSSPEIAAHAAGSQETEGEVVEERPSKKAVNVSEEVPETKVFDVPSDSEDEAPVVQSSEEEEGTSSASKTRTSSFSGALH